MTLLYWICALLSLSLLIYLFVALLYLEKFA